MRVVAIIQSRMGSTRLPGKAMLLLAGKPLTQNLLERIKRATKLDEVVLAVPGTPENECLWQVAHDASCHFYWYRGDENDLVGRYLACAESFNADLIVRIPGDNPCVEPRYIDAAVKHYLEWPVIFETNTVSVIGEKWVDGIGAEVFSLSRLKWLDQITLGNHVWREHVHRYFCDNEVDVWREEDQQKADVRLDVNTREDYEFIKDIYDHFGHNRFTVEEVLLYLDRKEVSA